MSSQVQVSKLNVTKLEIKLPAEYKDLSSMAVRKYVPEHVEFDIAGVNTAIATGLRRSLMSEIPVLNLTFDYDDFSTNNPFTLIDMIQSRIQLIPIDQTTSIDAVFALDASNNTGVLRDVYSSEITVVNGAKVTPFNDTFVLCTLEPEKYLKISNITVQNGFGYKHAGNTVAFNAAAVALDVTPPIPSSVAAPTHYRITFNTNGTIPAKKILLKSCQSLISRTSKILELVNNNPDLIAPVEDFHAITIEGESYTIGNLIVKTAIELYPDISLATYKVDSIVRKLTVRLRSNDDINIVTNDILKHIIAKFTEIMAFF